MHPYRTLKVPLNASSEEIREAYLDAIRKYPPERDPVRFRKLNQAFAAIETEDARIKRELGLTSEAGDEYGSPLESAAAFWQAELDRTPPSEEDFYAFLKAR